MYLVDCNVTGEDVGTVTEPKFALKLLWKHVLLPAFDALVAPGGLCEHAMVVHQEDNAGPHTQGGYHEWLKNEFERRGWRLELQAPQGPYTNVLDLQLFPSMSKHHSRLVQIYNNTEASSDRIWSVAENVWKTCSSATISRAFVHAYRIMKKIIAEDGNNAWLADGTPHCDVRKDFYDTDTGIKPRTKREASDTTQVDL